MKLNYNYILFEILSPLGKCTIYKNKKIKNY